MNREQRITNLRARLDKLNEHRKRIQAELDRIMMDHIEVQYAQAHNGPSEEAQLFSLMTKARLIERLQDHWRTNHMDRIGHLEQHTKSELVNMLLSVKGIEGTYSPPPPKAPRPAFHRTRSHIWRS
jgi:hypothetical protein